jgi:imidazolonepropionase-like amidohydrolase
MKQHPTLRWKRPPWQARCLGIALFATGAAVSSAIAQGPIAITNVSVIDATNPMPRNGLTVIIRGDRITDVGPSSSTTLPEDASVIDGRGRYLIPGMWDMHVHTVTVAGRTLLGLYVANGVTGVRDMASEWDTLRTWRSEIARGTLTGPRIVGSGPYVEGGDVPIPHVLARTPEEGIAAVDSLAALGVDFIKVHAQLTPQTYYAVARRARERDIPFVGHVSQAVGALNASDSGQRSIEHMLGIPAPCTYAESIAFRPRYPTQAAIGRCSTRDLAPVYAALARNRTWVTPTFTAAYDIVTWPHRAMPGDTLAHYLPDTLKKFVASMFPMPDSIPAGADAISRAMFAIRQSQVVAMRRAGVSILTGTDAPLRNSPPGFGLHEELALLAAAGMSNFDVLRSATFEPARYLGAMDSLGTVAPGKLADLVLLEANPLVDIRNTRRICVVIANGRVIDAKERQRLLAAPTQ